MNRDRWQRIRRAIEIALDAPEPGRTAIVTDLCPDEHDRAEALALLAHDADDTRLQSPCDGAAADVFAALEAQRHIGDQIGPYTLVSLIATGGMGDVYLAKRSDGAYDAMVAIKLVRAASTIDARRRFSRERRTLARLDHPGIARLLDAGEHDGAAYLVMEYVEGLPLLDDATQRDRSIHDRVRLMRDICDAVAHAHRNLVIHRDLKPANILVTDDAKPKLLDFGISKLLEATDQPTITSAQLFTPRYASPEQLCAEPVTTATDVYALGVILYELLTQRAWPERPGISPWDRVPAIPSKADPRIDRELDAIVRQAAAARPDERYPSPEALGADLDRYLTGRPIRALPASRRYLARKWAARHRAAIAAATAIVLILIAGAVAPTILALRLAEQQRRTLEANDSLHRINDFLTDTIRQAAASEVNGSLSLASILDDAIARVDRLEGADPAARAVLRMTIANSLFTLGRYVDAETQYGAAVADLRGAGAESPLADALIGHSAMLRELGRFDEAEAELAEAVELSDSIGNDASKSSAHLGLARLNMIQARFDEAHAEFTAALGLCADLKSRLYILDSLAEMSNINASPHEGVGHRRTILALLLEQQPEDSYDVAFARMRLARSLRIAGQTGESVAIARRAVDAMGSLLEPDSVDVALARVELAQSLEADGHVDDAIDTMTSAVADMGNVLPPDHQTHIYHREILGLMLARNNREADARPHIAAVVDVYDRNLGPDHQRTRYAVNTLKRIDDALDAND